jgi:hypothetical protein
MRSKLAKNCSKTDGWTRQPTGHILIASNFRGFSLGLSPVLRGFLLPFLTSFHLDTRVNFALS